METCAGVQSMHPGCKWGGSMVLSQSCFSLREFSGFFGLIEIVFRHKICMRIVLTPLTNYSLHC